MVPITVLRNVEPTLVNLDDTFLNYHGLAEFNKRRAAKCMSRIGG